MRGCQVIYTRDPKVLARCRYQITGSYSQTSVLRNAELNSIIGINHYDAYIQWVMMRLVSPISPPKLDQIYLRDWYISHHLNASLQPVETFLQAQTRAYIVGIDELLKVHQVTYLNEPIHSPDKSYYDVTRAVAKLITVPPEEIIELGQTAHPEWPPLAAFE